jgi:uncharacterized protein (TIGR02118 family)
MLKFVVVLYRRADLSVAEFRRHLRDIHAPLAKKLPGLRKYVHNYPAADPKREAPSWDAIVELYFDDWSAMEAAWATPEGSASDADLPQFADLNRSTWSAVETIDLLP